MKEKASTPRKSRKLFIYSILCNFTLTFLLSSCVNISREQIQLRSEIVDHLPKTYAIEYVNRYATEMLTKENREVTKKLVKQQFLCTIKGNGGTVETGSFSKNRYGVTEHFATGTITLYIYNPAMRSDCFFALPSSNENRNKTIKLANALSSLGAVQVQ